MDIRDPLREVSARAWMISGVIVALFAVTFWSPIAWMVDRWLGIDSYYSHGFFVPLVTLYLVWRDRHYLLRLRPESSRLALAVMLCGIATLLISGMFTVYFTAAFGMLLTIWGLCGFLFGLRAFRRLTFPIFMLTFMVPMPLQMIAEVSLKMKLLATHLAMRLLDLVGIMATNDGSTIYMESGANVTVGNACSGLRSLIALIFLGVLYAYISNLTLPRKTLLFLASMPIAIAANVVRVFMLCLIGNQWGAQSIEGFVHDASGYLIFVVAFLMLYAAAWLLSLGQRHPERSGTDAPPPAAPAQPEPIAEEAHHG